MTRSRMFVPVWLRCLFVGLLLVSSVALARGQTRAADIVPGMTVLDVPMGTNVLGAIGVGPDGNLWFTEYAHTMTYVLTGVGRITPAGDVAHYPLPPLDRTALPSYAAPGVGTIVPGPDGNLWFTEYVDNQIGRVTPAGVITEFPTPTSSGHPGSIVAGADGNLWYAQNLGANADGSPPFRSKIVRLTPAGAFTEFDAVGEVKGLFTAMDGTLYIKGDVTLPPALSATVHIAPIHMTAYQDTVGPDGNFWSVYWSSCRPSPAACYHIYRTTPGGAVTDFGPSVPPNGIALGADGNLWFSTFGPLVGRITTAGTITLYNPPTGVGETRSITAGSDGNLWIVTEKNKIIRLEPNTVVPSQTVTPTPSATTTATPPTASTSPVATPASSAACAPFTPNSAFAVPGFQAQWRQGEALAPNFWGPTVTGALQEPYAEAAGGQRLVQYFDKGRMELADPTSGAVTNGLLATELLTGNMQTGDQTFPQRSPSGAAIAGDPDDFTSPTYGQINSIKEIRVNAVSTPGAPTTRSTVFVQSVGYYRTISTFSDGANFPQAAIATYDAATSHNVPMAFASYRNRAGLATIGYAITEPFWADVKVGGVTKHVLIQVFQRRVLTYTPDNPPDYLVEMGNVGQHYYHWRYCTT